MPKLMCSYKIMTSRQYVHLPTEVLVHIAGFIYIEWSENITPSFQATLHNFCLVSRQWYSAGIEFLYSRPQLDQGNSFSLFTKTVCPSFRFRERKVDLGSLVQVLDLGLLVHHSSNSLTARLLGRVKKNLKTFVAPRISFAINSLAPLSKCKELSHLCLSLVAEPIALSAFKKAINSLNKLESLELPSSTFITDDGSGEDWPPNLKYLQVGGKFDIETMSSFRWPKNLEGLTLSGCDNLSSFVLENTLINEQLCTKLRSLTISRSNREMFADRPSGILEALFSLKSLRIPIDLLYGFLILPAFDPKGSPLSIRELELTAPCDANFAVAIDTDDLCRALKMNLARVCALGISPDCLGIVPESSHAKIDRWAWKNIDKCPEDELDSLFDLGLYVIDSEPSRY